MEFFLFLLALFLIVCMVEFMPMLLEWVLGGVLFLISRVICLLRFLFSKWRCYWKKMKPCNLKQCLTMCKCKMFFRTLVLNQTFFKACKTMFQSKENEMNEDDATLTGALDGEIPNNAEIKKDVVIEEQGCESTSENQNIVEVEIPTKSIEPLALTDEFFKGLTNEILSRMTTLFDAHANKMDNQIKNNLQSLEVRVAQMESAVQKDLMRMGSLKQYEVERMKRSTRDYQRIENMKAFYKNLWQCLQSAEESLNVQSECVQLKQVQKSISLLAKLFNELLIEEGVSVIAPSRNDEVRRDLHCVSTTIPCEYEEDQPGHIAQTISVGFNTRGQISPAQVIVYDKQVNE